VTGESTPAGRKRLTPRRARYGPRPLDPWCHAGTRSKEAHAFAQQVSLHLLIVLALNYRPFRVLILDLKVSPHIVSSSLGVGGH